MALVLQVALSFGHFHAFAVHAAQPAQTSLTKAAAANGEAVLTQDRATETIRKQQPSNDRDHPSDVCDICAVISLASSALSTAPPVLVQPQAVDLPYRATDAGFLDLQSKHSPFQSRAPPVS